MIETAERAACPDDERRLHVRAYHHWTGLLSGRTCPAAADLPMLSMLAAPGFRDNAIVLDRGEEWTVRFIGERLAALCGGPDRARRLDRSTPGSLAARIAAGCADLVAREAPVELASPAPGARPALLYRGVLLPFAGPDGAIATVVGIVSGTGPIAGPDEETAVIGSARRLSPRPERAIAWADGPLTALAPEYVRVLPERLRGRLRALPHAPLAAVASAGGEFPLLLARRTGNGKIALLGEVPADGVLLEQAARLLLG